MHDQNDCHRKVRGARPVLQAARHVLRNAGRGPAPRRCACSAAPGSGIQASPFSFADEARTVCIIAGGPSVTPAAVEHTRGWPCIAVNDAWRLARWADVLYACDDRWWDHHIIAVRSSGFGGQLWTQAEKASHIHGLQRVCGHSAAGLGRTPGVIHFGQNSGYQAINLAFHWGARRLVLLGFDCNAPKGRTHWFGQHPSDMEQRHPYSAWLLNFTRLAADLRDEGVSVVNTSLASALKCWPKQPVEAALARLPADSSAACVPA